MTSDVLSPRERAAVLWAEHVTLNTARSRDDVFEEVAKHFDAAEIVELTLMSGLFAMFNRLMDSLQIPVEIPKEVDKIQRSLDLDPDKVLGYFETVAETWPTMFPEPPVEGFS
ncbi:MAG: carboxymuconolactone decarboxylase family protein [Acidimicrobiales bacterium]